MYKTTLIHDMTIEVWGNKNFTAIDKNFSNDVIYDSFIEKAIGKKNIILIAKKFFNALSENTIKINDITKKNDIVCIKWDGSIKHTGIFYGLHPTGKKLQFNVIGFYKMKNSLITEACTLSNLKFNMVKNGSIHCFSQNNIIKQTNNNEILLSIKNICNINLTNQEIATASLWLSGHSNKSSAKILNISSRTVEEYRTRIKNKLDVKDKKQLYVFIRHIEALDLLLKLSDQLT